MNRLVTEIFGFVLTVCHIIILLGLVLFVTLGDNMVYDGSLRVIYSIFGFVFYAIIFGAITTIVTMKDELVEVKQQLIESNTKMAMFFGYIEEEITNNNSSSKKKPSKAVKESTDAFNKGEF